MTGLRPVYALWFNSKKGHIMSNPGPIGLILERNWLMEMRSKRIVAILAAMKRFSNAGKPIPEKWVLELERHVNAR